ncbi:MAG: ABC transporter permease subunit [Tannerellaceae bacterium]|jgi:NitT/TauT family transport system permease protein|nr:ABC transporter permease subunit [Tannerellaceae bacterium]
MAAALHNALYWKPHSIPWFLASIASLALAWAETTFVPNVQAVNTFPYRCFLLTAIATLTLLWFLSSRLTLLRIKIYHQSQFLFALGLFLTVWDLLTTKSGFFRLPFFPGPAQIIAVMTREYAVLLISTAYSMRLFFVGLLTGTALGLTTGILIGWYRQWNYWLFPLIKLTGVIPAVAWMPIAIVIFPDSFSAGVFLITIASWFSVAFMVAGGIASTPKTYYEVAKTLGANEAYLLRHVAIPNAVPGIFTGVSTATGLSFLTLVISEMVGAKAGLGWYINWAKGWSAYDKVYASIIIMAIAFSLILAFLSALRNHVLRWQRGIVKVT